MTKQEKAGKSERDLQARLRRQVEQTLLRERREAGNVWLHREGRLFLWARILLWICSVVNFLFYSACLLGWLLNYQEVLTNGQNPDTEAMATVRNSMFLAGAAIVVLIAALVLMQLRRYPACAACFLASGVPMLLHLGQVMNLSERLVAYLLRHVLPIGVSMLCSVYLLVVALLDRAEVNRAYNRALQKIHARHGGRDEITTSAQWEDYLREYLDGEERVRVKRSVKHRRRKEAAAPPEDGDAAEEP